MMKILKFKSHYSKGILMILNAKQAMHLALKEAKKGEGWVEPNPPVGCVILDFKYNLLSQGYHKKYGSAHAEMMALNQIKDKTKLKKARVFVTLEPCHHQGKTPSCAKALANFPLYSLCYGAEDPFTQGRGLHYLREKNIKITKSPDFQQELENLVLPFKFSLLHKQAFVSLKAGVSLDGKMALKNGESQWITSPKARWHAHSLRAKHSAVLVGVNTFLKDNPRLNIRLHPKKNNYRLPPEQNVKTNKLIILDPEGKSFSFLKRSAVAKSHPANHIILCCDEKFLSKKALTNPPVKIKTFKTECKNLSEVLPSYKEPLQSSKMSSQKETIKKSHFKKRVFSLPMVLKTLYQEENISSILVEGGSFCLSEFLRQKSAQRLYLYMAPRIIGQGLSWSGHFTIPKLSQSLELNSLKWDCLGKDLFLTGLFS